jgi:uncharacterized YkwD family protein/spore coat assembly protein SafA
MEYNMFKKISAVVATVALTAITILPTTTTQVEAASTSTSTYTVVKGDTLWKIAVKTTTGVKELIALNSQLANPDLIYPGDKINVPAAENADIEQQVLDLVNKERAANGLKALQMDWQVARVAEHKSQDMAAKNYFDHTSPTYGSPFDMLKSYGISYKSAGENIAKGQKSAQEVVTAWMNSSGHRANILNSSYTHIGVGYVSNGNIWTQLFIQK